MKQLIACCGLDCEFCNARIATLNNDNELREKTAQEWSVMYNSNITPESINCVGCRVEGVKIAHCNICEIRTCAETKGHESCGTCTELDTCPTVGFVLQHVPDARENLLN